MGLRLSSFKVIRDILSLLLPLDGVSLLENGFALVAIFQYTQFKVPVLFTLLQLR